MEQQNKLAQETLTSVLGQLKGIVAQLEEAGITIENLNAPAYGDHSGKQQKPELEELALKDSLPLVEQSGDNGQTPADIAKQEAEGAKTADPENQKQQIPSGSENVSKGDPKTSETGKDSGSSKSSAASSKTK